MRNKPTRCAVTAIMRKILAHWLHFSHLNRRSLAVPHQNGRRRALRLGHAPQYFCHATAAGEAFDARFTHTLCRAGIHCSDLLLFPAISLLRRTATPQAASMCVVALADSKHILMGVGPDGKPSLLSKASERQNDRKPFCFVYNTLNAKRLQQRLTSTVSPYRAARRIRR